MLWDGNYRMRHIFCQADVILFGNHSRCGDPFIWRSCMSNTYNSMPVGGVKVSADAAHFRVYPLSFMPDAALMTSPAITPSQTQPRRNIRNAPAISSHFSRHYLSPCDKPALTGGGASARACLQDCHAFHNNMTVKVLIDDATGCTTTTGCTTSWFDNWLYGTCTRYSRLSFCCRRTLYRLEYHV
jgi:hypothetical protein